MGVVAHHLRHNVTVTDRQRPQDDRVEPVVYGVKDPVGRLQRIVGLIEISDRVGITGRGRLGASANHGAQDQRCGQYAWMEGKTHDGPRCGGGSSWQSYRLERSWGSKAGPVGYCSIEHGAIAARN